MSNILIPIYFSKTDMYNGKTKKYYWWRFARAEEPDNYVHHAYCQGKEEKILSFMDAFQMKYRQIEEGLYFIDQYTIANYASPSPDKYILQRLDIKTITKSPSTLFVWENTYSIRLYEVDAEGKTIDAKKF